MALSIGDLFLAYRQAKASLHQEQQGAWKISWARAELRLPALLKRLQDQMADTPGWFSHLDVGNVWLLPKKSATEAHQRGITHIGGDYPVTLRSLAVRPHLTPSISFAIVEVLWLWNFGAALESLLGPNARGNRLKLINSRREFDRHALSCFEFWPEAYRRFREDGFEVARRLLKRPRGRCLVTTLDLTSYYDEIDPTFLLSDDWIRQVERQSRGQGIQFYRDAYATATATLLDAYGRYRAACYRLTGIATTRGVPIGCLSSKLVSNLALASLDDHIRQHPALEYYARYVDDMLIVARASPKTPRAALNRTGNLGGRVN